jgi:vancomycin resistance protein YoaR
MPERQTSPDEVSPDKVSPDTVGPDTVTTDKVSTDGVSPDGVNPHEVDPGEANPGEANPGEANPGGVRTNGAPRPVEPLAPADHAVTDRAAAPDLEPGNRPTDILPPVEGPADDETAEEAAPAGAATVDADAPTEVIDAARLRTSPPRGRRALLVTGAVVALLAVLYVADLALSAGTVPRGVTVAGQAIGGLSPAEAEQRVRAAVEPRTGRPVDVAVGGITSQIDPRAAGLSVDWAGTIRQAGAQPLNPITRVRSLFGHREVGVVTTADDDAVDGALGQLVSIVNRPPAEGAVRFEGVTPVPVPPVDGQDLDLPAAREVLERDWTSGSTVQLPTRVLKPTTTMDDVTTAIAEVATPAVSGPVTVLGENVTGTITPEVVAKALSFRADPNQGLVPELDQDTIREALDPQLAKSEQPGRDAAISFAGGRPVVTPSQDGRGVDYDATLKDLVGVLTKTGDDRRITAVYTAQQAKLTTEELNGYGITEVMGEFTTGGFAVDSGRNIKRAAEKINGTIIKPGETFSLNQLTEPRDAAHGYVEAGVISDGHASRDVGGGVSQVATTTYNAAYFAGMTDVVHKPHSFYISRYPPGREATVVAGPLDLRWRNDTPGGVLVQTVWTPSTLTVRIWGTKRYAVTSTPGPRTNPTQPSQVKIPAGEPCTPSQGAPGFTITDTRTIRDLKTGAVRNEKRTTKYNPAPIVTCGSD